MLWQVEALDERVAELAGFDKTYMVTGQTYSRKVDSIILAALAGIGVSAHKVRTHPSSHITALPIR